jgi:phosphohistidine phosphatase
MGRLEQLEEADMLLYLVQHARALEKEEDPERALSEQGWSDVKKMASFVSGSTNVRPAIVFHSGKTRARQTAETLGTSVSVQPTDGLEPLADPSVWAQRLADIYEDIMLVGHLPHLSRLAGLLLCGEQDRQVVDFRNAGIVCLQRDPSGDWSLRWIMTPELLRE